MLTDEELEDIDLKIDSGYLSKKVQHLLILEIKKLRNIVQQTKSYSFETLEIDFDSMLIKVDNEVRRCGGGVMFKLLMFLVRNKEIVFSLNDLIFKIWGSGYHGMDQNVRKQAAEARKCLGDYGWMLKNIYGCGYVFTEMRPG